MQVKSRRVLGVYLFLGTILTVSLACNMANLGRLGRSAPTPIPVSTQAAGQLVGNLDDAMSTALAGGTVNLVLTESQLTSLVALEMQKSSVTEIQNIQVRLRDGLIKISGLVTQSGISANATVDVKINVDAQGTPHSEIVSARFGFFPLPDSYTTEITKSIDSYLLDQIKSYGKKLVVQQISIADGTLTMIGSLQ